MGYSAKVYVPDSLLVALLEILNEASDHEGARDELIALFSDALKALRED